MAFTGNYTCNSFLAGLPTASFNFGPGSSDIFKMALYTNNATLDATTDAYTTAGEVSGAGYSAGGIILVPTTAQLDRVSYISFANVSWTGAFTARGALIYKDGGAAICVLDFGADRTSTTTFQVQFPIASTTTALLRISA